MFPSLDDDNSKPSQELEHFTNRIDELAAFNRILKIPRGESIPLMMFYGVSGTGKTWLLKRIRQDVAQLPTAYLDLDPNVGSPSYQHDTARPLGEIRRQLGSRVKCPKFDLAYTWLRFHQGFVDEPLFKGSGMLGNCWEFIVEAGNAAASDIPGASLVTLLINKISSPVKNWLGESGVGDWLATKTGQQDFIELKDKLPGDIYLLLHKRLLEDLRNSLPAQHGSACRAVVFIDTVESIGEHRASHESLLESHRWLRDLYHPESGLLIVLGGRDRLSWGQDPESPFAIENHLEQHLVGGLSEHDALKFLTSCKIIIPALQKAILKASLDNETTKIADKHEPGYYPFSLGLCADTCLNILSQNKVIDPAVFDMSIENSRELAARFLRSLGGDGAYAEWLKRLALAPQFDEAAARACFSKNTGAEQDFAWHTLTRYSFFQQTQTPGWFTLHVRMRESLGEIQRTDNSSWWRNGHEWWQSYWRGRANNEVDFTAAKSWYHYWCVEPLKARSTWHQLATNARYQLRMSDHFALLNWWAPCALEAELADAKSSVETSGTLNILGVEFLNATLGDRNANLRRAIECYEAALRIRTEEAFPHDWATTQDNLANAYAQLPAGDRDANLHRAIECYEAALRISTEEAFPQAWAGTQNNLANAYSDLPSGDRDANLHRAIECYEAALRISTEEAFPQAWAATQHNLAAAYGDLPSGDRDANLHRAIECYEAALRIRTEEAFPHDWATTQNNLANTYSGLPSGDRDANLRRAIECYEAALRISTEETFPQDCATTQNNLANAYARLPSGDRDANLRRAIECYEAALRIRTEEAFPRAWAATQNNLAAAYGDLPSGDRDANLRRAIECYEAALRIRTEEAFPHDWATTQNNLANAYAQLPAGDRDPNLRRAIECYEAALRIRTEEAFPQAWASTQNNLANAYTELPAGDRDANLRRAIECHEAALRIRTEGAFPQAWATTQYNLANAYAQLPAGDRDANLRRAIECYEAALRISTEEAFPQDWASTQYNLAAAYAQLPAVDRNPNLQRAIECYEAALRIRTEEAFPHEHTMIISNLEKLDKGR